MLLNSFPMVGAILIEICTSAPYRPGHWLLSDVAPEPQTLRRGHQLGTLQKRATTQSVLGGGATKQAFHLCIFKQFMIKISTITLD